MKKLKIISMLLIVTVILVYVPSAAFATTALPINNATTDATIVFAQPVYSALTPGGSNIITLSITNNSPTPRIITLSASVRHQNNIISKSYYFKKAFSEYSTIETKLKMVMPQDISSCSLSLNAQAQNFSPSVNYYVSPTGSDTNTGTQSSPFKSIQHARDLVRQLKNTSGLPFGGIAVYLLAGEYSVNQTISFTEQDSGSVSSPIIYSAYPGADVRFTGAYNIPSSAFSAVTDSAVLQRIPSAARVNVLQADLKSLGFQDYSDMTYSLQNEGETPSTSQFFVNDQLQSLAKWPNTGYATMGAVTNNNTFVYSGTEPSSWENAEDAWVSGFFGADYWNEKIGISAINTNNSMITLEQNAIWNSMKAGQRYYVYNLLEELDTPGEWYLNRNTGMLYYYPNGSLLDQKIRLSKFMSDMFSVNNCQYVQFSNIKFEDTCDNAVSVQNSNHVLIAGCSFSGIGRQAVDISGGSSCGILSSDIYDCGKGGVFVRGGDRPTLTRGNHYVRNCEIYNFSTEKMTYSPAVLLNGCGNTISHNRIHDGPHEGIDLSGNDQTIEYNEMYNVCTQTGDCGAIYCARDWTQRGNVITGNLLHDFTGWSGNVRAIYLDDMISGTLVKQNTLYNVGSAIFIHGGRDNTVLNNIIANSSGSIWEQDCDPSLIAPERELVTNYNAMPVTSTLWMNKYPHISNILQDEPSMPKYNNISGNLIYKTVNISYSSNMAKTATITNNIRTTTDPGFTNASGNDYTLKSNSSVYTLIPNFTTASEKAGMYTDNYRN